MKIANWKDYKVLMTSRGEKLESWGGYCLLRPDPQIIWDNGKDMLHTRRVDAYYTRGESKSGKWNIIKPLPHDWCVNYRDLKFRVQLMNFKHTGLFPEQAVNWDMLTDIIRSAGRPLKVLNLFAYTGAMSVVCSHAGASVTHVDAAKSMVDIAKQNAELNGISNIRYIVDDCKKFIEREIRRGHTYDIILMDPPSFGRGPNNETWKIEDDIYDFVKLTKQVLSDHPVLVLINSYTTGLQPTVMMNILNSVFGAGDSDSYELCIPTEEEGIFLPCGCTAVRYFDRR